VAAVWSCAPGTALAYPARYLFSFLDQHGLLTVTGSPPWLTVTGGSARYVELIAKQVRLQRLGGDRDYVVTLNGDASLADGEVLDRMEYAHPVYDTAAVAAQTRLPELNDGVTAFAGAYHGWGFHEDGCRSGVTAAASLGARW
jgi:predicted NAD/FAD-binding protein